MRADLTLMYRIHCGLLHANSDVIFIARSHLRGHLGVSEKQLSL